jgi:hypothetical protein
LVEKDADRVPDSFDMEDWLDIEETPEKDRSGVKQDDTGVGNRPGEGEPDRERACSSIFMIGVPGSIVMAGRTMLDSLVGVTGSSRSITMLRWQKDGGDTWGKYYRQSASKTYRITLLASLRCFQQEQRKMEADKSF